MKNPINLTIERFQENGQDYYVATSSDIQGLVAEADTIDAVIDIAKDLIPILLELPTKDRPSAASHICRNTDKLLLISRQRSAFFSPLPISHFPLPISLHFHTE